MKGMILALALSAFASFAATQAQAPDLNIGGAGARAMGMGGAFTAVADDATATYYNPAGLAQLKRPEITLVGYYSRKTNDWAVGDTARTDKPGVSGQGDMMRTALNFGSIVYPLNPGGHNAVLALSSHLIIDALTINQFPDSGGLATTRMDGGIYTLNGYGAYELNKYLMVGAGFSFFNGEISNSHEGIFEDREQREYNTTLIDGGPQVAFGLLGKLTSALKLGLMYKLDAPMEFREFREEVYYDFNMPSNSYPTQTRYEEGATLDMPQVISAGVACRLNDELTLAADYQLFKWGSAVMRNMDGTVNLNEKGEPDAGLKDSGQVHVGAEYLLSLVEGYPIPVRLGFYSYPLPTLPYMQEMAREGLANDGILYDPAQLTRYFYTAGIGVVTANSVLDLAVEFSALDEGDTMGTMYLNNDNVITKTYLSAIFKF